MIRGRELLTKEQRKDFMKFPNELNLASYYTFSIDDLKIIKKHRREENQLGFALQLAILRYPGWSYITNKNIPDIIVKYIAKQINTSTKALKHYALRESTSREHIKEIKKEYNYKSFSENDYNHVLEYLITIAFENDDSIFLIKQCISVLKENKIILPAMTSIEGLVWEAREKAESIVIKKIISTLNNEQRFKLDTIVFSTFDKIKSKTILGWLKEPIGRPSSDNFLKVIEKLEYIRTLNLESLKLDKLHMLKITQIYNLGQKYEPYSFRDFHEDKRHAILAIFLLNLSKDLTDKAFEIHDRVIQTVMSNGRKAQEEIQRQNGKKINEKVIQFTGIGDALIHAKENDLDPIKLIEESIGWSTFVTSVNEAKELARPSNYDYLDLIEKKYTSLRRYTPRLLECLNFKSFKKHEPILESIEILKNLNANGKRKVPDESPTSFMSKRWKEHVIEKDGSINRRYYELAVLTEIRDRVKAGDISIDGSKQYKDFEEYLISKTEWNNVKEQTKLSASLSFQEYITGRYSLLNNKLEWISKNSKNLDSISIEKGKISIARLEKNTPKEGKQLSIDLYKTIPKISLPDLLLDIAKITGFHNQFTHASTNKKPTKEDINLIMAALLGMGTNIGLSKMADATPNITYKQLAVISEWRMYEDAMKRAQDILVNYHHNLNLSKYWGDGTTSSCKAK